MTAPSALAIEHVPVEALQPAPYNPRKMADSERARLERGIREFGLVDPIIARRGDGLVIGGHQRLTAAKAVGLETVPVVYLDGLTDDRAAALNVLLNNPSAQGVWDMAKLSGLLSELDANGFDATLTGFDDADLERLLAWTPDPEKGLLPGVDPDAVPDLPAKPVTKLGDLIVLGRHRLVCGDCRDFAMVERLMDGRQINVVVTSPPYASQRAYDPASGFKPIPPDEYVAWYRDVATNVMALLAEDGSYFCNIKEHCDDGQRHLYVTDLLLAHVREWGWRWVDTFCWKRSGVPGRWENRFKNGWEPVYHYAKSPAIKFRPEAVGHESDDCLSYSPQNTKTHSGFLSAGGGENGRKSGIALPSNVLDISTARADKERGHTAEYPVALPIHFVRAFSDAGDAIYDPFMGSGTTLIAAEQEGRTAYGTEISPAYCDVIVTRWENATGQKAVRP